MFWSNCCAHLQFVHISELTFTSIQICFVRSQRTSSGLGVVCYRRPYHTKKNTGRLYSSAFIIFFCLETVVVHISVKILFTLTWFRMPPLIRGQEVAKSLIIVYNKDKFSVNLSYQLGSYGSCLRKIVKWYQNCYWNYIDRCGRKFLCALQGNHS